MWRHVRPLLAVAQHPFQKGLNSIFNIWLTSLLHRYVQVDAIPFAVMVRAASTVSFVFSCSSQLLPLLTGLS